MSKRISSGKLNFNTYEGVLSIEAGGTGATDPNTAKSNLNIVGKEDRNAVLGVAGLDENSIIYPELIPSVLLNVGGLNGPEEVNVSTTTNYTIAGYSSFEEYTVSSDVGTITRNGATITFIAPSTPRLANITLNSRVYQINVKALGIYINTPSIVSPTPGSNNQGPSINFISSTFGVSGGTDTHEGTDWQIATDASFTNIVASVTNSSTNKTSWTAGGLQPNTTYYARLRYKGSVVGYSAWSTIVIYTTKNSFYPMLEEAIITAIDNMSNDQFGTSVDLNDLGDYMIIGSPLADVGGTVNTGRVDIYNKTGSTWTRQIRLLAATGDTNIALTIPSGGSIRVVTGGAIPSDVTYTSSQNVTIPAGTTSIALHGKGGPGTTTYNAGQGNAAYPSGLPPYQAESGYWGTSMWPDSLSTGDSRVTCTWSRTMNASGGDENTLSPTILSAIQSYPVGFRIEAYAHSFGPTPGSLVWNYANNQGTATYSYNYEYLGITYSGTVTGYITREYTNIPAVGNPDYPSGLPPYVAPGYTYTTGTSASAVYGDQTYAFAGGYGEAATETTQNVTMLFGADSFGSSVAIAGNGAIAVIGASSGEDSANNTSGVAYVFTRAGSVWSLQQKLQANDTAAGNYFGCSVAISDDGLTIAIGSSGNSSSRGSVHIFTKSGSIWTQQTKLIANDGIANDQFGKTVAISSDGNTVASGAPGNLSSQGAVYIHTRSGSTWSQQAKIIPSNVATSDQFGISLDITTNGNMIVAGSSLHNGGNGVAYVFTRSGSTWTQQYELIPIDLANGDSFGYSVTVSKDGSIIMIGSPNSDPGAISSSGSAYIFTKPSSNWVQQIKLTASNKANQNKFGSSVALAGNGGSAVISAPYADPGSVTDSGSIYTFI